MAEIRVNATGGLKLYDADDSHYAQIKAGTVTSNTDVLELGSGAVVAGTKVDLNGQELILDADADTSITADTDDQIDVRIAGADDFQFTANTFTAQSGSSIVVPDGGLTFGSTAISSTAAELNILDGVTSTTAELNILDGVTATASELNLLDGGTSVGSSITLADADGFVVNDGGTMKTIPASDISTYAKGGLIKTGNQYSASSASTITLDNVFSSSYGIYRVIGYFILGTDGAGIELQLRDDSPANFNNASDQYRSMTAGHRITSSSDTVESHTNGDYAAGHWKVNFGAESNGTDGPDCLDMMFYDTLSSEVSGKNAHWRVSHHGNDGKHYYHYGSGQYTSSGDAAGFVLAPSSGSFSRHKVTVYGFNGSDGS